MGVELIRAVHIEPDGIYLKTKSINDGCPFRKWKSDFLTVTYIKEGLQGLDREIVKMLCNYARVHGNHHSITRYRPCLGECGNLHADLITLLNAEYAKLSPEDLKTLWFKPECRSAGMQAYDAFKRDAENKYYSELAQLAEPFE